MEDAVGLVVRVADGKRLKCASDGFIDVRPVAD